MEYVVGASLALIAGLFGTLTRMDRDRAFYPTVMVVVAACYDLFAAISGSAPVLGAEALVSVMFIAVAVLGFRTSLWWVVAALAGHGVFDLVHAGLIADPGVPAWWPGFCASYDIVAAVYLAAILRRRRTRSFASRVGPNIEAELQTAANFDSAGDPAMAFWHLERAHVLAQASTVQHVRVHIRMLAWGLRYGDPREVQGQMVRILGAATKTPLGLIPAGNTGGADVSPFKRLPVPMSLAAVIQAASKPLAAVFCVSLIMAMAVSNDGRAADARTAEVAGQAVAYRVQGAGKPVLVLLSGLGDGMASFSGVAPELAQNATVITYDRAGYGGSASLGSPTDAVSAERELLAVLRQSGVPGPYVLVGHSLGGLYAEYFAARHPDLVAGLVLEESRPADFGRRCEADAQIKVACTPTPEMVRHAPAGEQAEVAGLASTVTQVEAAGRFSRKPVLVISRPAKPEGKPFERLWTQAQADLAACYPGARHLNAPGGGHYVHRDQRAWFVASLRQYLTTVR
jgi:pimeloyl-ACP methyl ester carboxylesterase